MVVAAVLMTWLSAKTIVIEEDQLKKYSEVVTRNGDTLKLKLRNGKSLLLKNSDSNNPQSAIKYVYGDFYSKLDLSFVKVFEHENAESNLLIDHKAGGRYQIIGRPQISPDGKRIVTSNFDIYSDFSPNGIQIWKADRDKLSLEWSLEPGQTELWGPTDVIWVTSKKIQLNKTFHPSAKRNEKVPAILSLEQNGWLVREAEVGR